MFVFTLCVSFKANLQVVIVLYFLFISEADPRLTQVSVFSNGTGLLYAES